MSIIAIFLQLLLGMWWVTNTTGLRVVHQSLGRSSSPLRAVAGFRRLRLSSTYWLPPDWYFFPVIN